MGVWQLQHAVPLAQMTTLKIGGTARFFSAIEDITDIEKAITWAKRQDCPLMVLGAGSNVVVADRGFDGLVVRWQKPKTADVRAILHKAYVQDAKVQLQVPAWCDWDALVAQCVASDLGGLECLSGIPGLSGAAPIQNIGAYGQQVSDTLIGVRAVDTQTGAYKYLAREDCLLDYRASLFKNQAPGRWILAEITLQLHACKQAKVHYPQLLAFLQQQSACTDTHFSLQHIRQAVLALRTQKSMLVDPTDPNSKSVGSFFVNPVVVSQKAAALLSLHPKMPQYPSAQGVKLSAAWLIEQAGFARGYRVGSVGISSHHSLALINCDNATAAALIDFARKIQQVVMQRFGVWLIPEPNFFGFVPPVSWAM